MTLLELIELGVRAGEFAGESLLLLDLGVPPHIVRDIVGHSDIGVTMTIYAHASLEEKRAALRKLDDRLK